MSLINSDLKLSESAHFTYMGSSFHSVGAAAANDHLTYYAVEVFTGERRCLAPDLRQRMGLYSSSLRCSSVQAH